jgi:HAMP domain-containing protein
MADAKNGVKQRRWRNFLLDRKFQLRFTAYFLLMSLCVAAILGVFLWNASRELVRLASSAVEARNRAAEQSHELGNATLSNELVAKMNDPAFEAQFRRESKQIDERYDLERAEVVAQREGLDRGQRMNSYALVAGLLVFVVFVVGFSIVTTHRIAGPVFRIRRMMEELAQGKVGAPRGALRPGDELQDLYASVTAMVTSLRTHEADVSAQVAMLAERAPDGPLKTDLSSLSERLRTRLVQ